MEYGVVLVYDAAQMREVASGYYRRKLKGAFYGSAATLLATAGVYFGGRMRTWPFAALLAVCVAYFCVIYGGWLYYSHRAAKPFRAFGPAEVAWVFRDDSFGASTSRGKMDAGWDSVKELMQLPNAWLLCYGKGLYNALPLRDLPEEVRAFIVQRVKEAGGRID